MCACVLACVVLCCVCANNFLKWHRCKNRLRTRPSSSKRVRCSLVLSLSGAYLSLKRISKFSLCVFAESLCCYFQNVISLQVYAAVNLHSLSLLFPSLRASRWYEVWMFSHTWEDHNISGLSLVVMIIADPLMSCPWAKRVWLAIKQQNRTFPGSVLLRWWYARVLGLPVRSIAPSILELKRTRKGPYAPK